MHYSPVRHSTRTRRYFLVRLACVRHAASVRSEPGSNSSKKYDPVSTMTRLRIMIITMVFCIKINLKKTVKNHLNIEMFKDSHQGSFPSGFAAISDDPTGHL